MGTVMMEAILSQYTVVNCIDSYCFKVHSHPAFHNGFSYHLKQKVLYQVCIHLLSHSECFPCIEISDPLLAEGLFPLLHRWGKLRLEESAPVKAVIALRTWPRANPRPWCLRAHFSVVIPKPLVYIRNLDLLIFPDQ